MLGPIERYALRFVENYYPNGLSITVDPSGASKKGVTIATTTAVPADDQTPLESSTPKQEREGGEDVEEQKTKIGPFGRRVPMVSSKGRGRGRAKTIGAPSKSGILQTPGRSFPDYFSGKEPKAKGKAKRRGRGRGGWRGRPRVPGLGSGSGSQGHALTLELEDRELSRSGSLDSPRDIDEEEEEDEGGKQGPDSDRELDDEEDEAPESEAGMSSDRGDVGDFDDEL